MVLALAAGVLVGGAGVAYAAPVVLQPGELVVNGDAEQVPSVGWTGALSRATHGSGGYPASIIVGPAGATGGTFPGGVALFTGIGASSVATQVIDLSPSAAAIDNAHVTALLSAYVGGYLNQNDNASVTFEFRDVGGAVVASTTFGPVLAVDRGNIGGFVPFSASQALPVGTRSALVTISTLRFVAPANDGYVDNISLVLDAPVPTAAPDTATTPQDVPVTVTPRSNDIAGTGATLVPSSVRLLDGATETATLATADGTYQVNTTTGDVVFTPAAGFVGTAAPVSYRITDSSGQKAESTITIDVTFVAAPALTLVKSASPSAPADFVLGTPVAYSFVVTNTGNVTMNAIAINEVTFSGENPMSAVTCPQASLVPAAQQTCTATYTLTQNDIDSGSVVNTATASGVAAGSATTTTSAPSSFGVPIAPAPAITLEKTVAPTTVNRAGDVITYSFLITNTGNISVNTLSIDEVSFSGTGALAEPTCPSASLLPGQEATCTVTYELSQADVDAGSISNVATATANAAGAAIVSLQSSAVLPLLPQPIVTLVKAANRISATLGELVTYSFTVTNAGNVTVSQVEIKDTDFSGSGTLSAITCPATTIAPSASLTCTATYAVTAADVENPTLVNTATASVVTPTSAALTTDSSTASVALAKPAATVPTVTLPATLPVAGVDPLPLLALGALLMTLGAAFVVARVRRKRV